MPCEVNPSALNGKSHCKWDLSAIRINTYEVLLVYRLGLLVVNWFSFGLQHAPGLPVS